MTEGYRVPSRCGPQLDAAVGGHTNTATRVPLRLGIADGLSLRFHIWTAPPRVSSPLDLTLVGTIAGRLGDLLPRACGATRRRRAT